MSGQRNAVESPNADYEINPEFKNRNPRNLERMRLAKRREGWKFQQIDKNYYYKLTVEYTLKNVAAEVEHYTGDIPIKLSTSDAMFRLKAKKTSRAQRAYILGQLVAKQCLQSGITNVVYEYKPDDPSETVRAFNEGLEEWKLTFSEPEVITRSFRAGIDYSKPNRYAERKKYKDDFQVA